MATQVSAALNDSIIASKAITAFAASLAPLASFSTDFSADVAQKGASVTVPVVANLNSSQAQNDYENADGNEAGVVVSLTGYRKVTVGITDAQFQNSSSARLENFAAAQAQAVARGVMSDLWANVTEAQYPAKVAKAVGQFSSKELRALRLAMSNADVPLEDRHLFLNPDYYDAILGDQTINVLAAMSYGGTEAVRDGLMPRICGFDTHENTVIPGNGENLVGFAVHPQALAVAVRALKPQEPSAYLEARVLTDAATGLTLGYRRHYSPAKGTHYVTFECLFGAAVGLPEALVRLVSA